MRSDRGDPEREVAVVTPWYPTRQSPFGGAFVRGMVEATAPGCTRMTVYHCDPWSLSLPGSWDPGQVRGAHRRLLAERPQPAVPTVAGAALRYVPVLTPPRQVWAAHARAHDEALRTALRGRPLDAAVVHAHVGLRGGWVALRNARPDARVFVTEHASFLDRVLEQPEAREMYDEVLHRCTGFFAVGEPVRRLLYETFPHHEGRVGLIPNPVSFDHHRPAPVTRLRRWLFVGNLIPRKGVDWLLEAFALCRAEDPELTLTLVGEGSMERRLTARGAELGLTEAVTFAGPVPPGEALRMMREHDLLVHPSRLETFGMTVVEAVAAGLPVLVTRSGGPQETLAGIEEAAGELIDVEENAESIADGYRRLRARFPHGLDLPRARRVLAERYGVEAVGRAHHGHWFGGADRADGADGADGAPRAPHHPYPDELEKEA
ncbi:glycosyltransferase [Streptomyces sp. NPDC054796]